MAFPAPGLAASRRGHFHGGNIFGTTITLSSGRIIPTRWIGEQHVREDLGFIPSFADWVKAIRPLPWMGRAQGLEASLEITAQQIVFEGRR